MWALESIQLQPYDLLLWDYGNNDIATLILHRSYIKGFFEKASLLSPNSAGFVSIYWIDSLDALENQCKTNSTTMNYTTYLSVMDYPILKNKFNLSIGGKLSNFSFLSLSLSEFCNRVNCSLNDIIAANTGHPTETGHAMMADLLIWQLLGNLKKIMHRECYEDDTRYGEEGLNLSNFHWTIEASWTNRSFGTFFFLVFKRIMSVFLF